MAPKRKACPFIASGISKGHTGYYDKGAGPGYRSGTMDDYNKIKDVCLGCTLEQCVESRGRQ